jgi:hypothetical protein
VPESAAEAIGRDRIRFHGRAVLVESDVDMGDWEFRTYRRTAVLFRDVRYFVSEKRLLPDGSYRYRLEPWNADLTDLPGAVIEYDESYVVARDRARREGARRDRESAALFFVSPLLGFLPSRLKLTLNDRYAFDPRDVTGQSLFLERVLLYMLIALLAIGGFTRVLGAALFWVAGAAVAVAIDLVVRTGRLEVGEMEQPGFCEWIVPSWRRRNRRRF